MNLGICYAFAWKCGMLQAAEFHGSSFLKFPLVPFKLTDIGEGLAEVEILHWHVKEGDSIRQFDNFCQVESDKATVDITSRYDGVVRKLHYGVGEKARVGFALADIEVEDDLEALKADCVDIPKEVMAVDIPINEETMCEKVKIDSKVMSMQQESICKSRVKILTSPSVRRLAKDHDINLANVVATGPAGRLLKEDVLKYLGIKADEEATMGSAASDLQDHTELLDLKGQVLSEDITISVTSLRASMMKTMKAATSIPQLTYADEIHVDALHNLREDMKGTANDRGIPLSYMPFVIKATSLALRQYPMMNAAVSPCEGKIKLLAAHNISIAMDTPQGLIVPNVKNVHTKSIMEIAQDLKRLQDLANSRQISSVDLIGGSFTLSNIGSIGGTYMAPILLLPQVAIGAIGKMQVLPRFDQHGNVTPARIMNVSWSADHRVLDGATIARFSNLWKSYVEQPSRMLTELV